MKHLLGILASILLVTSIAFAGDLTNKSLDERLLEAAKNGVVSEVKDGLEQGASANATEKLSPAVLNTYPPRDSTALRTRRSCSAREARISVG